MRIATNLHSFCEGFVRKKVTPCPEPLISMGSISRTMTKRNFTQERMIMTLTKKMTNMYPFKYFY